MKNIDVQVVKYDSWSDSTGVRINTTRYAIVIRFDDHGKAKYLPIMSNHGTEARFKREGWYLRATPQKFGVDYDSFFAWGYEEDYDKSKRRQIVRKRVQVDLDEIMAIREAYWTNGGEKCQG